MISKFLRLRKIKQIQKNYSVVYDHWKAQTDESAKGLIRCLLQDLAHAYDVLAVKPVHPIPGLCCKFLVDDVEASILDRPIRRLLPFLQEKEKEARQSSCGIGIHLKKLYKLRAEVKEKQFYSQIAKKLEDAGCPSDIDIKRLGSAQLIDFYVDEFYVKNKHKWKRAVC